MNKKILSLFAILAIVQLAVPMSMILKRELVLKEGQLFWFKTAPVDPYDAFRGRYVALGIEANRAPTPSGVNLRFGQKVYALLAVDEHGLAKITQVTIQKPNGRSYITAKVGYVSGNEVILQLPLDRYYMEEKAAPQAEQLYRERSRRGAQDARLAVKVKDGIVVIEGLYVGGERIEKMLKS